MGIDPKLLKEQCERTLSETDFPELGRREEGKVRDNYIADKRRFIVVTDRVSCFDVVVGTLPFKGQVLNQMAAFWFEKTRDDRRRTTCSRCPTPTSRSCASAARCPSSSSTARYLTGSTSTAIWTAYERGERVYCGHRLPGRAAQARSPARAAAHADHEGAEGRARRARRRARRSSRAASLSEEQSTTRRPRSPARSSPRDGAGPRAAG